MLRREFLSTLPAPFLLSAARKYVRLGIRTATYQKRTMTEAARLISEAGFQGVQLGLRFTDRQLDLRSPDWDYARRARDVFGAAGLKIDGLDGYVNMVHPDPETRRRLIQSLCGLLAHAKDFGTRVVGTEAGAFYPNERGPRRRPDDLEAAWKLFMGSLRELVKAAEDNDAVVAFEPTQSTIIGTIQEVRRMLDEVSSPHLKIIWDPAHYYTPANAADVAGFLREMYASFGADVVMAHANDFTVVDGAVKYCDIGLGQLDFGALVSLLEAAGKDILLAVEHTQENDVARVKKYLAPFMS